ncbi:CDP-diacylglycerol-glycerol-3-phosphate 3-phosphatidyltransferase [Lodderomyces elongisporus NRRL YB-4239]|uniref:CDP-diacylglycerol--glycerol-3-phosphate 3-phosphatidyltransferase n=1 Tax=Lodderomyces elongisporus (strain ATCC 11503 / CBS 2605 / JCM 1781 / NBRC 1676 / NRRL YB-4239) TaxID=379508 RepID=A5E7H6_LODEL|nr:CDP-diacylglycerol-glycerol-3-phosphate 3-phosphatidyltransferase [Lodderomyces elongisporus NRRL YB-4239]
MPVPSSSRKSLLLVPSSLLLFKQQLRHRSARANSKEYSNHYSSSKHTYIASSGIPMISSVYNYFFNGNSSTSPPSSSRQYSTNNPAISDEQASQFHPRLATIFQQLDSIAPRFFLQKGEIEIIQEPTIFYETLKNKILSAKTRIFLSSLYIGKTQHELISCLDKALAQNPNLQVLILTDCLRGTREAPNNTCSASLLVALEEKYTKRRVDIRMYHTPHLSGLTKSLTPKRINEGWGLQHMKLYGFDDEIILSGANLSQDYFTDRQDRYYLFKNKAITDYYYKIHNAISSISYQILHTTKLKQGFKLVWPTTNPTCEPHLNQQRFISDTSHLLLPLLKQHELKSFDEHRNHLDFDTVVYAVSQFTPLFPLNQDLSTEKPAVLRLLSYLDSPKIKWWFTAGYFNMLSEIQDRLINGQARGKVITASPKANSFYKSPGVSYYLPEAYLLFAKKFLEHVKRVGKEQLITVYEWQNGVVNTPGGWTYHAKGIWITVPEENDPSITIIGSSNYTKRAYSSDLESNAIIITKDETLKREMTKEIDHLMEHVTELTLDDFQPKQLPSPTLPQSEAVDSVIVQDVALNGEQQASVLQLLHGHPPKYAIDEDRKISYGVRLAVKILGGKL